MFSVVRNYTFADFSNTKEVLSAHERNTVLINTNTNHK